MYKIYLTLLLIWLTATWTIKSTTAQPTSKESIIYFSTGVFFGANYINHHQSEMELSSGYEYQNKTFFSFAGNLRIGTYLSSNLKLESGIDLYGDKVAMYDAQKNEYRLDQGSLSLPLILMFQNRSTAIEAQNELTKSLFFGIGPFLSYVYSSDFNPNVSTNFSSFNIEEASYFKAGIMAEFRINRTNESCRGHVFGIRAWVDLINFYDVNKYDYPYTEPPMLATVGVFYNFLNLKIGN